MAEPEVSFTNQEVKYSGMKSSHHSHHVVIMHFIVDISTIYQYNKNNHRSTSNNRSSIIYLFIEFFPV